MDDKIRKQVAAQLLSAFPLVYKNLRLEYRAFESNQFTPAHMHVLFLLEKNGSLTNSEISDALMIARPNVSAVLQKLLEMEFVEKRTKQNDKRFSLFYITEKGIEWTENKKREAVSIVKQRLDSLEEEDIIILQKSISEMIRIVQKVKNV